MRDVNDAYSLKTTKIDKLQYDADPEWDCVDWHA